MFSPNGGAISPLTTKGDLWGFSTNDTRVAVGANGLFLGADSANPAGVSWQSPSAVALAVTTVTGAATFTTNLDVMFVNGNGTTFAITLANAASFPLKPIKIERIDDGITLPIVITGLVNGATNWRLSTVKEAYELIPDGSGSWRSLNHYTETNWAPITTGLTFGAAWGTTQLNTSFFWRRKHDEIEISGSCSVSGLTGAAAAVLIPMGQTLNTGAVSANSRAALAEMIRITSNSAFSSQRTILFYDGSDASQLFMSVGTASGGTTPRKDTGSGQFNNGDNIMFRGFAIPLIGWNV